MKKCIKVLFCVLIISIILQANSYAVLNSSQLKNISNEELEQEYDYAVENNNTEYIELVRAEFVRRVVEYDDMLDSFSDERVEKWENITTEKVEELDMWDEQMLYLQFNRQEHRRFSSEEIVSYWNDNYEEMRSDAGGADPDMIELWYEKLKSENDPSYENVLSQMEEILGIIPDPNPSPGPGLESNIDINYWKPNSGNNMTFNKIAGKIIGTIQIFGSVVSVCFLIIIGIKYMFGSVEEKAKYKETMIPYIVGCIMIFGITNVASILYKIGSNLNV